MNKLQFDNLEPADKLRKLNEILSGKDKLEDSSDFDNLFPGINTKN